MAFTRLSTNERITMFSDTGLNLVDRGTELINTYRAKSNPKKYVDFSILKNYDEANKRFHEKIVEDAYEVSGLDPKRFSLRKAFEYQNFERTFFSVIEEVINRTITKSNLEDYMQRISEVRNLSDGDSANIDIRAKNIYILKKVGRGTKNARIERHYGQNVVLSPEYRQVKTGFDIEQIAAGRFDYGREIALAAEGIRTSLLIDVIDLAYGTTNPINNKLIENSYSEDTFRLLAQRVKAFNGGLKTMVVGTDIALSTILPSSTEFYRELGEEYMQNGYIANAFGYTMMALPQAVDQDYEIIVPNDRALILTSGVDTPIKIGMTNVRITQIEDRMTADRKRIHILETEYDVKLASDAHFGLQRGL